MAAEDDFRASLAEMIDLANDLEKWFYGIGFELKKLGDPSSQRIQAMTVGGGKAAGAWGNGLQNLMNAFDVYVNEEITNNAGDMPFEYGFVTGITLTGATPDNGTVTVTGEPWVRAGVSRIFGFSDNTPRTSASEPYFAIISNLVEGTGFDFTLYAPLGCVSASDYTGWWIGFPDG